MQWDEKTIFKLCILLRHLVLRSTIPVQSKSGVSSGRFLAFEGAGTLDTYKPWGGIRLRRNDVAASFTYGGEKNESQNPGRWRTSDSS